MGVEERRGADPLNPGEMPLKKGKGSSSELPFLLLSQ